MRLIIDDDTGIRRDRDLAIGKGIQGIDRLIYRHTLCQLYDQFYDRSSIIRYTLDLYFSLFIGFQDALDQSGGGYPIRHITDGYTFLIHLFYTGTHQHLTTTHTVIIIADVCHAFGKEVGI
ncbi:hypothetical protein D9M68_778420 [compost metagenome]